MGIGSAMGQNQTPTETWKAHTKNRSKTRGGILCHTFITGKFDTKTETFVTPAKVMMKMAALFFVGKGKNITKSDLDDLEEYCSEYED